MMIFDIIIIILIFLFFNYKIINTYNCFTRIILGTIKLFLFLMLNIQP